MILKLGVPATEDNPKGIIDYDTDNYNDANNRYISVEYLKELKINKATERTKEIGIRRAIGATEKDILLQFLSESVVLSLFGGIGGLLLAVVVVLITRFFFPASINLVAVVIAIVVSSAIGIFFGIFPARRAAKLPPIEAIRYE